MKQQLQSIMKSMLSIRSIFALTLLLGSLVLSAQTVLINPTGDGGFENGSTFAANGWTVSNSANNPWEVGASNGYSVAPFSGNSAFVRDTGSTIANYGNTKIALNYFYRTVSVPAGQTKISLTFNWIQNGENSWDMWQVFVADTNIVPVGTTTYPGSGINNVPAGIAGAAFVGNGSVSGTGVQTANLLLPSSLAGTTFRLIFAWKNDGSGGTNPPAIIDNISLVSSFPLITNLGGLFTIDNMLPTGGSNFNSFIDAISELNVITGQTLLNPITFNVVAGQTFSGNLPEVTASGNETNRITFQRFGVGANPLILPAGGAGTTDYGIGIAGADYVTFDGIDVSATNNTLEYGYRIRNITSTNGAKHIIVRNATIKLDSTNTSSIGLIHTTSTVGGGNTAASVDGQNDSCQYHDLVITNCGLGGMFITSGSATFWGNYNRVWNVTIGSEYSGLPTGSIGGSTTVSSYGIQFNNQAAFQVYNSTVRNIMSSGIKRGIYVLSGRGENNLVYNNRVYGIRNNLTTGLSATQGISVTMSTTTGPIQSIHVFNNEISDLTAAYTGSASATRVLIGMFIGTGSATTSTNISNNSIVVDGSGSPTLSSVALEWGGSNAIYNVRNNNLVNLTGAQTGVAKHYILRTTSATLAGAASSIINNNNYFLANTTNGFIALRGTTDAATLSDWRTGITSPANIDASTTTANPMLLDIPSRNFTPQNDTLDNAGLLVAFVTTDINGNPRSTSTPDIGSIEFELAIPSVQTKTASGISATGANLGGIISSSFPAISVSGVVYGTTPNPTIGGVGVVDSTTSPLVTSGDFTFSITGLAGATTYYARAYATNAKGTAYGEQVIFTTTFNYPFVENFDGNFSPNANGWNHTRYFMTGNGVPTPLGTPGPKDWVQNKNLGIPNSWALTGFSTTPANAVSDSGVLWIEDYYFANSTNGVANFNYSRVETPGIDLSTAVSPYVRFYYYANQSASYAYPLILMGSTDNGATWQSIMRIQPNADVVITSTSGSGTMSNATPWQRITVKVPDAYKSSHTKFAFYRNSAYSFAGNLFIDSLFVGEYTPSTITSAQTGSWNDPNTWVGGVVPNADNHVEIATGHTITSNVNMARMQNLTLNGTFIFFSSTTISSAQIFGNLNINSSGTFNAGTALSSSVSRFVYIGEGLNNAGTLNMGTSTAHSLFFVGGIPSTITNTGTITNGYISRIDFANSGGITFNPASTNNVVVRNAINLIDGPVTPNGKLTAGLSGNALTISRGTPEAYFTSRPLYPNLNTAFRSVTYGGGVQGNFQMAVLTKDTIFPGNETDSLPSGVNFIRGTLTLNTSHHVKLNHPLQVGDTLNRTTTTSSTTGVGGALSFFRGLLFTDATNILTVGPNSTGSLGAIPSNNTVTPPNQHGSYIVGPVRFVRPQAGTTTSAVNVPLGLGSNYLGADIVDNVRRYMTISAGAGWAGVILQCELLPSQIGAINPPQTSLIGKNIFNVEVLENRNLPATSLITLSTYDETGKSNRDELLGNQNELFVVQSNAVSGPWTVRSNALGTATPFAPNLLYTRQTVATAPGPVSGNGAFFSFATTASRMQFVGGDVERNTSPVSIGAPAMQMLRIKVEVSGVMPVTVSGLQLNTTGTTNPNSINTAKVYYTGNDANFNANSQFGQTVIVPSGTYSVSASQRLVSGDNYFWVLYDVSNSAALGNVLTANLTSIIVDDTSRVLITLPATGGRTVSLPMTFVSANAFQPNLSKVEQASVNNKILGIALEMSATGAPVPASVFTFNTNGSANPAQNISNAKLYYTGSSNAFGTSQLSGTTANPNGTFTINTPTALANGMNYFWLTYDIPSNAIIGDSVDGEFISVTINNVSNIAGVSAPVGAREIRAPYCASGATSTSWSDIGTVILTSNSDTLMNIGQGCGINQTWASGTYTNNTNITGINLPAGSAINLDICYASLTNPYNSQAAIYIDFNQNGVWDAGEMVWNSTTAFQTNSVGTFTIPCSALPGPTRMRVVLIETGTPLTLANSCGTYSWGETEDYTVNIQNINPLFTNANTVQQTGFTSPGSLNLPILRVPITVLQNACNPEVVTQLTFNTFGSTSASDIVKAKLFKTGNSTTFSPINAIDSIISPSGSFSFVINDTVANGLTNYWLAYDVSGSAVSNNVLDARFDSVQWGTTWYTPTTSNPSGNILIGTPMLYQSANAIHPTLSKIERGSANNVILRMQVVMSSTGAPVQATAFNLSTNGSANPLINIDSTIVWYTGNNPDLVNPQFVGGVGSRSGAFTVNGFQNLLNDTNYFWVTYNVPGTANVGDSVDCELSSIVIDGVPNVPATSAPVGAREIRAPYCASGATSAFDTDLGRIILTSSSDTLMNVGQGCGANQTWASGTYTNNTAITGINLPLGAQINLDICNASTGTLFNAQAAIYIDLNQNGLWEPGEMLWNSTTPFTAIAATGSFTIPCNALTGPTRMRVVLIETVTPLTLANSCGTFTWGETEDYTINIVNANPMFGSATAIQQTGVTSAGSINLPILRLPINVVQNSCNPEVITQLVLNTAGTTAPADITMAKLYKTGASTVFSTATPVDSVFSPNGSFSFVINDTAINGVNNYWLAYDVSGSATNTNVLDARFDSVQWGLTWYLPDSSNPAGNVLISTPMTYLSSDAIHTTTSKVERGSVNNQMLRVQIITSSAGAPIPVTSFSLNTNGSANPLSNIDSVIVWYTGSNPNLVGQQFFGGVGAQSGFFTVSGSQNLLNDTNYFWVTYNIPANAIIGDSVDCEIASITIDGVPNTPTTTAPIGSREIRAPYCVSTATSNADTDLGQLTMTYGSTTILNNGIGCSPASGHPQANGTYSNFTALPPVSMIKGSTIDFSMCNVSGGGGPYAAQAAIYIDFNENGTWEAGEMVWNSTISFTGTEIGSFIIPLNVKTGQTRMRVVLIETNTPLTLANACGTYTWGETEDYTVNILPAPIPTAYVWNQTGSASFTTATNWTPNRVNTNLNDILVFNSLTPLTVNNVPQQTVSSLNVLDSTVVNFNNLDQTSLRAADTLAIGAGAFINNAANVTLTLGTDTINQGLLVLNQGSGRISGKFARFVRANLSNYVFPMHSATKDRRSEINYTTAPSTGGLLTVEFINTNPGDSGLPLTDGFLNLVNVAEAGFWRATASNGLAGGTFDIQITAQDIPGVNNYATTALVVRGAANQPWLVLGSSFGTTGTNNLMNLTRTGLIGYGEVGIAGDATNPLPVNMLSFDAVAIQNDVLLNWTTAGELNNEGFEVERSIDGNNFEKVGFVKGNGNTRNRVAYDFVDESAFRIAAANTLYYRLRQVDFDGAATFSNIVRVSTNDRSLAQATVSPNPFTGITTLNVVSSESANYTVTITDVQGKVVGQRTVNVAKGNNQISLNELSQVGAGVYFVQLIGAERATIKVVKTGN